MEKIRSALLAFALAAHLPMQAAEPFRDPNVPVEERVGDLLGRLTLDEKLAMLGGTDGFFIRGVPRLGLPDLKMGDGPVGVRNWGPATLYPATQLLAATWNEDLAHRFGVALGRDSRARGMHVSLAPGVNIYRSPLCGRNYEYLGEDPLLAARLGTAAIRGVQSQGVAATIKHFAGNNSETRRSDISNDIDERALREIYLPAFESAVAAGVWCVMDAYNPLNGRHCTANSWLNNDLLKKEWGFSGVVMSDWNATHDTMGAALGGLDLEMPAPVYFKPDALAPRLRDGSIPISVVDDKVRRLLRLRIANGWLDRDQEDKSIPLDDPRSAALALEVAREGITLLKNQGDLLPLDRTKVRKIALLGPNAFQVVTGLGSGRVRPFHAVTLQDALRKMDVGILEVPWNEPLEVLDESEGRAKLTRQIFSSRRKKEPISTAETDRVAIAWDVRAPTLGITEKDLLFARWTGDIEAPASGARQFVIQAKDINVRVWIDGELRWDSVREGTGSFVVGAEEGKRCSVRIEAEQRKKKISTSLKVGWGTPRPLIPADAAMTVREADAAVVCVGYNILAGEGEGYDRAYRLPGRQEELIREVAALNPRTIVVLNAGGAVATEGWLDQAPAFLDAYYFGQEGGTALAEILFGEVNPSGRLPFSYERRWEDCAAFANYPADHADASATRTVYREGVFVGYRWFDRQKIEPLFPFGHGLGYTSFAFQNLQASRQGDKVRVKLDVTNTGDRPGTEVVQVYVGQARCSVERPVRELKDFARVSLRPGQTESVNFLLDERAFAFFHPEQKRWTVESGSFAIEAGASSRDIRQSVQITYNPRISPP